MTINTSVIVPTFNGEGKIGPMIDRLLPLMGPGRELIVIDDGSRDGTASLLNKRLTGHPHVRWYSIANRGRAGARNFGAMQASGTLIVFLDDDIEVSSSFLDRMEQVHRWLPSAWITGTVRQKIVDLPHVDFLRFRAVLDYDARGRCPSENGLARVNIFTTQQLGVSREVFLRIGGFREGLKDAEDYELSIRAGDAGYEIVHDTMNVVLHADFSDFDSFVRRQKEYVIGWSVLREKRPELVARFPERFYARRRAFLERIIRSIFVYNIFLKYFLSGKIRYFIPTWARYKLYDYILSSTVISASPKADSSMLESGLNPASDGRSPRQ